MDALALIVTCQAGGREALPFEACGPALLCLDILMAQLNALCGAEGDHFEYVDDDGDVLAVRTDAELASLLAAAASPLRIRLKEPPSEGHSRPAHPTAVALEDLRLLERLADGQFGTVYRALNVKTDTELAVKAIGLDAGFNSRTSLLNEIDILKRVDSAYVVRFHAAIFTDSELLICLELMDGLSLELYGRLPRHVLAPVTVAVVMGLSHLWERRILHRDLKASNVLVNRQGAVKLADFGVAKHMANSAAWSYVGTKVYMAPERVRGAEYKVNSDVWSLGLSLLEMALGRFPATAASQPSPATWKAPDWGEEVRQVGADFEELIGGCLRQQPTERLSPDAIRRSPFFRANIPVDTPAVRMFVRETTPRRPQ